jgi:glycosyltransferase involved in cell wall biosynthesis
MASFNNESTIEAAIDGIMKQTFKDFELILINDGSTDQTKKIMEKMANNNPSIHFINNSVNIGKSLSVNLAVLRSKSEFFAIADGDDIWLPDKLEIQMAILQKEQSIDVLGGQLIRFGDWGHASSPTKLPLVNSEIHEYFKRGVMAINNPTAIIRKSSFLSIGGYRGVVRRVEDFDLFIRMHEKGMVFKNLEDTLVKYRTMSKIQPFAYWIRHELDRQEILWRNSNLFLFLFPFIRLPVVIRDFVRMSLIYFYLRLRK